MFGSLKLSPPITTEEFEKSVKDINLLRESLIYWGKI